MGFCSQNGAVLLDGLDFPNLKTIMNPEESGEMLAFKYEFKRDLNVYLSNLLESPIKSLADAITFNENHADEVSFFLCRIVGFVFFLDEVTASTK